MALLIWKIIGYGIVLAVVGGIVVSVLSAVGTILLYIFYPIFFIGGLFLSVITYPLTVLIQASGYKCPMLFSLWLKTFENRPRYERPASQRSQVNESKEIPSFDPWAILEVSHNASREEIITAYKRKLTLNHPDKVANLDSELQSFATRRTVLLRKAYEQLVSS